MKSDDAVAADVAIVGGGFSGTMLAAQLARRGLTSVLIDGSGRAGRGTAFSTPEDSHLLNVAARRMSAWPDRPDHFADAVADEGYAPGDFVPRRRFGYYLRNILEETETHLIAQCATGAIPSENGWAVTLADGSSVHAGALALAQGNQPPELPAEAATIPASLFVNDPWSEEGRTAVRRGAEAGGDVLIIGTGLTMVDVVLSLDEAGHDGRILALSRRGQIPRAHVEAMPAPVEAEDVPQGSILALWRWLRRRAGEVGWRAAVDSLRPRSQALWRSLSALEQGRFLRHARPWWDVHRHRIAPEVSVRLKNLIAEGRLQIAAGRIETMAIGNGLEVSIRRRGKSEGRVERFAMAVNCTGPLGRISASSDPIIRQLLSSGSARPDAVGMGLAVDENCRVSGSRRAWALGPLTKGAFWEVVAVPDIREQVARAADDIARELDR